LINQSIISIYRSVSSKTERNRIVFSPATSAPMQIEHNASRSSDGISIEAGQHADDVSVEAEHRRHRGRGGVSPRRSRQWHDGAGAGSADLNHGLESNLKPETVERKRNRAVFLKTVAIFFFHNLYNIFEL
jgi:hypothetical protein